VVGHSTGRRPVPRAVVLRTVGHHRAVPRHDAHGPIAQVVGSRAIQERDADHMAREPSEWRQRDRRGRLRDIVRSANRAVGQRRRPHGTGRSTDLGS